VGAKLYHRFVSAIVDATDTTLVRPQANWNDTHDLYLGAPNAQTGTTYSIAASDDATLITFNSASPVAVTLPQANSGPITPGTLGFFAGWFALVRNLGAGVVTIIPATSAINGLPSLALMWGQDAIIVSDGSNYFACVTPGPMWNYRQSAFGGL
jgi:hypothetical protein